VRFAPKQPLRESLIEVSDEEFEVEFSDLPRADADRRARVAAAEGQIRKHPTDVDAWVSYSTQHIAGDLDGPFDKASAEVSLAILERGIKSNPFSIRLHLAYLRVARHVYNPAQIAARWEMVLVTFPLSVTDDSFSAWIAYLSWCETDGFGCGVGVVAIYSRVIDTWRTELLALPRNCTSL
jgi:hypothetical protein